ncbi:hypothetical protein RYX36_002394 [Vicia faba]
MINPRVFHVTSYGTDPKGNSDSTEDILAAIADATNVLSEGHLMEGITNLGGAQVNLEGGNYVIRRSLMLLVSSIGIVVTGQANIFPGVHCYNKATGFGGTEIYLKFPGLIQIRIVNSYMDYTSIVAEDPVQLHISSSFFLGDANIMLKSMNGVLNGVTIVDNMFSG